MQHPYPPFDSLPIDKTGPRGNAWGLWGPEDQLGTLNHLTSSRVRDAAKSEIQTGDRVSLNWPIEGAAYPRFQHPRKRLEVTLINKEPRVAAFDDEWAFNTQCSSQWDGCRHYGYQETRQFYMGRTAADFTSNPDANSVHHMAQKGIAGRAVFIDWYRWKTVVQGTSEADIDTTSTYAIPFTELRDAAVWQGTPLGTMQAGDMLIIRSGYLRQYAAMRGPRRAELDAQYQQTKPSNIGVAAGPGLLRFLWEKQIAAVAGDSRSFEAWPCEGAAKEWHLHQWLLAGWGMPIGELWDLEALSEECVRLGRWRFFLTSAPMNVRGGVASPPNALAFF